MGGWSVCRERGGNPVDHKRTLVVDIVFAVWYDHCMMMNKTTNPQIPDDLQLQLTQLEALRNAADDELNFRRLALCRRNPDMREFTDLELRQARTWYADKIDALLLPYEKG